jgi:SnoaL-like domain
MSRPDLDPVLGKQAEGLDRRSVLRAAGVGLGAGGLALAAGPEAALGESRASTRRGRLTPADRDALIRLKVDYALGTDAISAGDVARGLQLYRRVFTRDARITAGFDEADPLLSSTGPDELAENIQAALAAAAGSQHFIGTTAVDAGNDRRTARITAYFQATVLAEADKTMTTYLGTYFDEARRTGGRWRLTKSFAKYLAIQTSTRDAP